MADKVKFSITSDGTSEGTKIVINGDVITDSKKIVSSNFYASAATAYPACCCVGTCCCGCAMKQYPESIEFSYTAYDKKTNGERIYSTYRFKLSEDKWEPIITPLGKPVPSEADGSQESDNLNTIGHDCKIIQEILDFKGKANRYIPTRKELINRSSMSLKDTLEDLKKEI